MKIETHNWCNAEEILEHKSSGGLLKFIINAVESAPHFEFKGKSESKSAKDRIDSCQEHLNSYFDYKLYNDDWEIQPLIGIGQNLEDKEAIKLKADFRKRIDDRWFQIEVQCGNNSRYYADIIKFQMAWQQKLTDVAILIVPMNSYALRLGENICNYERLVRELPYLKSSLQLPILIIGFEPDENTKTYDLRKMSYSALKDSNLTDKQKYSVVKKKENRDRNIQSLFYHKESIQSISEKSFLDKSLVPKVNRNKG